MRISAASGASEPPNSSHAELDQSRPNSVPGERRCSSRSSMLQTPESPSLLGRNLGNGGCFCNWCSIVVTIAACVTNAVHRHVEVHQFNTSFVSRMYACQQLHVREWCMNPIPINIVEDPSPADQHELRLALIQPQSIDLHPVVQSIEGRPSLTELACSDYCGTPWSNYYLAC